MTRGKKIAAAGAAVIALVGAAGIAVAQQGWQRGGHHGRMMMPNLAERYDANKDGKISQEAIDTNRTSWHGEFDGNKDGGLALQEFQQLWLKARNQAMVREFQRFDRDGDGKVTLDEYRAPMATTVADMDRNGDGVLSRDDKRYRMRPDRQGEGEEPKAN